MPISLINTYASYMPTSFTNTGRKKIPKHKGRPVRTFILTDVLSTSFRYIRNFAADVNPLITTLRLSHNKRENSNEDEKSYKLFHQQIHILGTWNLKIKNKHQLELGIGYQKQTHVPLL